jgi:hypothetical protein
MFERIRRLFQKPAEASVTDALKSQLQHMLDYHTDKAADWAAIMAHAEKMCAEHKAAATAVNDALLSFVSFTGEDLLAGLETKTHAIDHELAFSPHTIAARAY